MKLLDADVIANYKLDIRWRKSAKLTRTREPAPIAKRFLGGTDLELELVAPAEVAADFPQALLTSHDERFAAEICARAQSSADDMTPRTLVILMYHAVLEVPLDVSDWCFMSVEDFSRQMEFVARLQRVVPLASAVQRSQLPGNPSPAIAITFDDGFRNTFDVALPTLKRFEIPATVFLPTAFVDSTRCLWFCRVNRAVATTRLSSFDWKGETYDLSSIDARAAARSARLQVRLKEAAHPTRSISSTGCVPNSARRAISCSSEESPYATMSTQDIHAMRESGLVHFGAHSESHAILSLLDPESKHREIRKSIDKVGELLGRPCSLFAYPNGRRRDYDEECITALHECGVDAAVTTVEGINDDATPRMELRRIGIGAGTTFAEFQSMLRPLGCE